MPVVLYVDYLEIVQPLWVWSFVRWWHWIISIFGILISLIIPLWAGMLAVELSALAADITFTDESPDVKEANERVAKTEVDVLQLMENEDEAKLLPLLRYSRVQLEAYYASGLKQTKRSYNNAMIAMWLGFTLLVAGIALFVIPLQQFSIDKPNTEFSYVIMGSAAIIEFIAAMFLWIYRSTNGQLTYYYRLQMRSHTAVLSFRMASTMTDLQDETKRYIIENMVDPSIIPERPDVMSSKGVAALLRKSTAT